MNVSSRRTSGAAAVETTGGHASGEAVGFPDDGDIEKVMFVPQRPVFTSCMVLSLPSVEELYTHNQFLRYRYEHRDGVQGCVRGMV